MRSRPCLESPRLHLFEGFGVELEYMIVDRDTLRVRPVADLVLEAAAGRVVNEVARGRLCWSNELVRHVIELKTNGPAPSLAGLCEVFQENVARINALLEPLNACLMGSAVHPFMDPASETHLWRDGDRQIYEALDRVFDCRGHGWSNLQAAHLNLPFHDDDEFRRLHAAVRLVLPLVPAIAAASPYLEGRDTGLWDSRLESYRVNCAKVPSVTGQVIPEPVAGIDDYHERILRPMFRDIEPFDTDGILQREWLNARGAIARFERHTIEIRLIDAQECPLADLAVLTAVGEAVRLLVQADIVQKANAVETEHLQSLLLATSRGGPATRITGRGYLACLGFSQDAVTAQAVWQRLADRFSWPDAVVREALAKILTDGPLAGRIRRVTGMVTPESLRETCRRLCRCLGEGRMLST